MTHDTDERLIAWLADGPAHGPSANLERTFRVTRVAGQRPAWLVAVRGGTIAADRTSGSLQFTWIVAAIAALTLLIGGTLVSGWWRPSPEPPVVLPSSSASLLPSPAPSALPTETGLVAYSVTTELAPGEGSCPAARESGLCYPSRLWISNTDGSGARELLPDPSEWTQQSPVAWSPDGSRLLYADWVDGLILVDPLGSNPQPVDIPCEEGTCIGVDGVTFSPDGSRIAFVRSSAEGSAIAIMDLGTGSITELVSTRTSDVENSGPCVALCDGITDGPRWSPDSTRLVFARQGAYNQVTGHYETTVYVVNADGTDLHRFVPAEPSAIDPDWSPDGTWIVFTSSFVTATDPETLASTADIYRVRPDGSGLRRLTSDGISGRPNWTRDGRIVFVRSPGMDTGAETAFELWVMDSDGSNRTELRADSIAALSAAGCIACPYPPMNFDFRMVPYPQDALWQPTP
jgi:sugar lactone lactonase YvrE